jgi:mRNA interferase MazF
MKRGDLVTVAMNGSVFGKPRPALVIQADQFEHTGTVTVLLLSGTLVDAPLIRLTVQPTPANGLRKPSQVMVDKAMSVKRDKLGETFGNLDGETMLSVTRTLAVFLGIA